MSKQNQIIQKLVQVTEEVDLDKLEAGDEIICPQCKSTKVVIEEDEKGELVFGGQHITGCEIKDVALFDTYVGGRFKKTN